MNNGNDMKTLLLVRHAKSASHFSNTSDFARTLNDRGVRDAIEMGKRLFENKVPIDLFVSSPAERAKTTAELFIRQYNRDFKEITYIDELYHSIPETFESVVSALDDSKIVGLGERPLRRMRLRRLHLRRAD